MAEAALDLREAVSLYLELKPDEEVDLEVAAEMAIQWSRAMKAAATAIDPDYEYRVGLIAAKPGSKNWIAKVERSRPNQVAKDIKAGWESVPLILRWTIGLVVVLPVTAIPTWQFWTGNATFSDAQVKQMDDAFERALKNDSVQGHRRKMFQGAQRDPTITGVGGGVPDNPDWRPGKTVPANQFAIEEGLFNVVEEDVKTRTTPVELDVILKSPDLENAPLTWVFKQPGIPGTIRAVMRDKRFLDALEKSEVRERFRTEIPMRVRIETKEEFIGGTWKLVRGGRSVVEVISPEVR